MKRIACLSLLVFYLLSCFMLSGCDSENSKASKKDSGKDSNKDNNKQSVSNVTDDIYVSKYTRKDERRTIEVEFDENDNIIRETYTDDDEIVKFDFLRDESGRINEIQVVTKEDDEVESDVIEFNYIKMEKSDISQLENHLYNDKITPYIDVPDSFYVSDATSTIKNYKEAYFQLIYDEDNRIIAKSDAVLSDISYYTYFSNGKVKTRTIKSNDNFFIVYNFDETGNRITQKEILDGVIKYEQQNHYENGSLVRTERFDYNSGEISKESAFVYEEGMLKHIKVTDDETTEYNYEQKTNEKDEINRAYKSSDGTIIYEVTYDALSRVKTEIEYRNNVSVFETRKTYYKDTNKVTKAEMTYYTNGKATTFVDMYEYKKK